MATKTAKKTAPKRAPRKAAKKKAARHNPLAIKEGAYVIGFDSDEGRVRGRLTAVAGDSVYKWAVVSDSLPYGNNVCYDGGILQNHYNMNYYEKVLITGKGPSINGLWDETKIVTKREYDKDPIIDEFINFKVYKNSDGNLVFGCGAVEIPQSTVKRLVKVLKGLESEKALISAIKEAEDNDVTLDDLINNLDDMELLTKL